MNSNRLLKADTTSPSTILHSPLFYLYRRTSGSTVVLQKPVRFYSFLMTSCWKVVILLRQGIAGRNLINLMVLTKMKDLQ